MAKNTVKTREGEEDLVKKKVKILSIFWNTLEEDPLDSNRSIEKEHRAQRGEDVLVPKSIAERYSEPDIDAFFAGEGSGKGKKKDEETPLEFAQMTEADIINWHRSTNPSPDEVLEATDGDPEIARKMIEAETKATDGDPREPLIRALGEVVATGTANPGQTSSGKKK